MASSARIGVVGGTGAVGTVTLGLLREHGFDDVRVFASARSAGKQQLSVSLFDSFDRGSQSMICKNDNSKANFP